MSTEISASCHQETKGQSFRESIEGLNSATNSAGDNVTTNNPGDDQEQASKHYESNKSPDKDGLDSKNDSSTLSTAFTISFDDDNSNSNNTKKLFGIRDSIRKFAPPKPHTIEKPRLSKNDTSNQDSSILSIESAPGGYTKRSSTLRREQSNSSCRSSGRRSESSRYSNISESAAFLIDKMLNPSKSQGEPLSSIYSDTNNKARIGGKLSRCQTATLAGVDQKPNQPADRETLEDEIDFCEDRSDNGTYIVGTDPESDAARKRIDELFGVVKLAEASLVASANMNKQKPKLPLTSGQSRPSRAPDKKPGPSMSRERQEHINRLATVGRHSSRSSSSSRQELANHRPRSSTRQKVQQKQRNSSCDRTYSKLPTAQRHHRRATSQSSRQSSNRDASDPDDTRSSRSSLHQQDLTDALSNQENHPPTVMNPGMKFNRAFALRRARLGLGEPVRPGLYNNDPDGPASLMSSPKRVSSSGAAHSRYNQGPTSPSANLSRTDGGRFSLRMRNNVTSRISSGLRSSQQPQNQSHHGAALVDSYLAKTSANKLAAPKSSSTTMPYPSGDELDAALLSPCRARQVVRGSGGPTIRPVQHGTSSQSSRRDIAPEWEFIDSDNRLNYSLGLDQVEPTSASYGERTNSRACQNAGQRGCSSVATSNHQQPPLGALDCLVISAISSLSLKIRSSVCDLMVEHAKRLPIKNETRLIVEEILPQLSAISTRPKSPSSIEEIDQSVYFDLAQTLKNLKKLEQMVDVMKMISNQIPNSSNSNVLGGENSNSNQTSKSSPTSSSRGIQASGDIGGATTIEKTTEAESNTNSEATSLSPI